MNMNRSTLQSGDETADRVMYLIAALTQRMRDTDREAFCAGDVGLPCNWRYLMAQLELTLDQVKHAIRHLCSVNFIRIDNVSRYGLYIWLRVRVMPEAA